MRARGNSAAARGSILEDYMALERVDFPCTFKGSLHRISYIRANSLLFTKRGPHFKLQTPPEGPEGLNDPCKRFMVHIHQECKILAQSLSNCPKGSFVHTLWVQVGYGTWPPVDASFGSQGSIAPGTAAAALSVSSARCGSRPRCPKAASWRRQRCLAGYILPGIIWIHSE